MTKDMLKFFHAHFCPKALILCTCDFGYTYGTKGAGGKFFPLNGLFFFKVTGSYGHIIAVIQIPSSSHGQNRVV